MLSTPFCRFCYISNVKKKKVTPSHRNILKMDYDQLVNYYIEQNPDFTAKQIQELWDMPINQLIFHCSTGITHIKK